MRKTTSPRQIAANRANAQRSTGPKTAAGRANSKMNALKHGILSKEVLVGGIHARESRYEFAKLHQRFREEWQPEGVTEEMLMDQIVTAHWRLRRALTAESGEIALSVDEGAWKRNRTPHPHLQWMEWELLGDPIPPMADSELGNRLMERWLEDVQAAVERDGELTEATIKTAFGDRTTSLRKQVEALWLDSKNNPEGLGSEALRERNKENTLLFLKRKLNGIRWRRERCAEHEESLGHSKQAAAVLPSVAVLEKIQRYETKLERQMYRAMSQLERLQRMRRGEDVPAPLTVEVSERD